MNWTWIDRHFDRMNKMFDTITTRFEKTIIYGVPPVPPSPPSVKKRCDKGWGLLEHGEQVGFYVSYGDSTVYDVTHCPWCGLKLEKA